MINPKWAVIAAALGVFALAAAYSAQLGLAVGIVFVVITAIALWVRVRFMLEPGEGKADRSTMARRYSLLGRNRRAAQAEAESRAQGGTDPAKRS
ncbi:MAG: hypothetical protein AAF559_06415 [Pseudomonadota bacterium]